MTDAPRPAPAKPDAAVVLGWTATARREFADLLDSLGDADWDTPSLCAGWTVRHVAAHVTTVTRVTLLGALVGMVTARGDFDRLQTNEAHDLARRFTPAELTARIRETADSPRRPPTTDVVDPLVDVLVHTQDVARPLGRVVTASAAPAIAALELARASRWYGSRDRLRGTRLVATDADWTAVGGHGGDAAGAEAHGSLVDLLLVATGRRAGLAGLTGPGAELITTHMAATDR